MNTIRKMSDKMTTLSSEEKKDEKRGEIKIW